MGNIATMEKNTSAVGVYSVKHAGLFRAVSVAVIISFLWQDIVFAQGGPSEIAAQAKAQAVRSDSPINLNQFSVPRTLATTKEIRSFDSKETVIMIKDAHDNLGAQESIAGLLDNLVTNYEIETIAVEGSSGFVDTSILSSFPDKEIKKKVTEDLMAEGFISAAEYFSVFTESDAAVYGIDDKALHAENMDAFKGALANAEKYGAQAGALHDALHALQDKVYSPELKTLEDNSVVKNNGNVGFIGRWQAIKALGAKYGVSDAKFTGIANLLKAVELEKKCDFASTNIERERLLEGLKAKLDKNRLEELILKSLSFKLGKISAAMYYSHLVDAARLAGIDPSEYENIRRYVDYMSLYEGVDIGVIKDEVAEYEGMIKEKIFRSEEERELSTLLKKASVIKDLLDVKLTSVSLNYYLANRDSFSAKEFGDFINNEYAKYQLRLSPGLDITALFEALPPAVKFYELTLKRNDAMVNNTIRRMREKGQTVAALVTGGFHSEGITELFRKDKVSYLVILPKFDKTKKRPYITIITNKEKSYKELFRKDAGHIALPSYFNDPKFIEYCVERLLKAQASSVKMSNQQLINLIRDFQESYEKKEGSLKDKDLDPAEYEKNIEDVKIILNKKIDALRGTAAGSEEKISPVIRGIAEKRADAKQKLIAAEEAATKPDLSAQSAIEGLNAAIRECNDNNVIVPLRVTRLLERLQAEAARAAAPAEAERRETEAAAHPAEAPPVAAGEKVSDFQAKVNTRVNEKQSEGVTPSGENPIEDITKRCEAKKDGKGKGKKAKGPALANLGITKEMQKDSEKLLAHMRARAKALYEKVKMQIFKAYGSMDGKWASKNSEKIEDARIDQAALRNITAEELVSADKTLKGLQSLQSDFEELVKKGDEAGKEAFLAKIKSEKGIGDILDLGTRTDKVKADLVAAAKRLKKIDGILGSEDSLVRIAYARSMAEEAQKLYDEMSAIPEGYSAKKDAKEAWEALAMAAFAITFQMDQKVGDKEGRNVRSTQELNAQTLLEGFITNQGTGQGKTFALGLANYLKTFSGNPIDLLLKDDATALRDFGEVRLIYEMLGVTCGVVTQDMGMTSAGLFYGEKDSSAKSAELLKRKKKETSAMIRYMSPTFIFDIQHDFPESPANRYFTRGFYSIIIDEVDSLFMDQSTSEFIIAIQGLRATFGDSLGYETANKIANVLLKKMVDRVVAQRPKDGKRVKPGEAVSRIGALVERNQLTKRVELTAAGNKMIEEIVKNVTAELAKGNKEAAEALGKVMMKDQGKWKDRIGKALDYIVNQSSSNFADYGKDMIVLIDEATGRDAQGRVWHGGLDQAARAALGMSINQEGDTMSKLTLYDVLSMVYDRNVAGTSGTAIEAQKEFLERLGVPVALIPDFEEYIQRLFVRKDVKKGEEFITMIRRLLEARRDEHMRSAVIERNDINELEDWRDMTLIMVALAKGEIDIKKADFIRDMGEERYERRKEAALNEFGKLNDKDKGTLREIDYLDIDQLTAKNEQKEKEIIDKAGERGRITFVTDIAGRATDIALQSIGDMIKSLQKSSDDKIKNAKMINVLKYVDSVLKQEASTASIKEYLDLIGSRINSKLNPAQQGLVKRLRDFTDKDVGDIDEIIAAIDTELSIESDIPEYKGCLVMVRESLDIIRRELFTSSEVAVQIGVNEASARQVAENIIKLTKDAPELREKTADGDFTDAVKNKRKVIIDGIVEALNDCAEDNVPDGARLTKADANLLKDMLLTKFGYGLLYIGMKSPLRRTDLQKGGRPGRSGDPGEYYEIVGHGLKEFGMETPEFMMLANSLWNADGDFRFSEFEARIEKKLKGMQDGPAKKEFEKMRGATGKALFEMYLKLYYRYFGYEFLLDMLSADYAEMAELIEDGKAKKGMESRVQALMINSNNILNTLKAHNEYGALAVGLNDAASVDRVSEARGKLESLRKLVSGIDYEGINKDVINNILDAGKAGLNNMDPAKLADEKTYARDLISQIFYAAQLSLEEHNAKHREDMDKMSVMVYQSELFAWYRGVNADSQDRPVEISKIVSEVINNYRSEIEDILKGPYLKVIPTVSRLSKLLYRLNRDMTKAFKDAYKDLNLQPPGALLIKAFATEGAATEFLKSVFENRDEEVLQLTVSGIESFILSDIMHNNSANIKEWKRTMTSSVITLEQIREGVSKAAAEDLVGRFWAEIEEINKGKAKSDDEKRAAINKIDKVLERLNELLGTVFGQTLEEEREITGAGGVKVKARVSLLTVDSILSGTGKKKLTEDIIADYIVRKLLSDASRKISIDNQELLLAVKSIRKIFLLAEQELRKKAHRHELLLDNYQKELGELYDTYMKDTQTQIETVAKCFIGNRLKKHDRKATEERDRDIGDIGQRAAREIMQEIVTAAGKRLESEGQLPGEYAKTETPRGPPGRLERAFNYVKKTATAVKDWIFDRLGIKRDSLVVTEILAGAKAPSAKATGRGERSDVQDAPTVRAAASEDDVVPVFLGTVSIKDASGNLVEVPSMAEVRRREKAAEDLAIAHDALTPQAKKNQTRLKNSLVTTADGIKTLSDQEANAGGLGQVAQAMAAAGAGAPGDVVVLFTGNAASLPPDDKEEYAGRVTSQVTAPLRDGNVTVYIIGDSTALSSTEKIKRDDMSVFTFTPEGAAAIIAGYENDIERSPAMTQQGLEDSIARKFGKGPYGIADIYGRNVFFKKTTTRSGDSSRTSWDVKEMPAGEISPADRRLLADIIMLDGLGGAEAIRKYQEARLSGKEPKEEDWMKKLPREQRLRMRQMGGVSGGAPDPDKDRLLTSAIMRAIVYSETPVNITFDTNGILKIGEREIPIGKLTETLSVFDTGVYRELMIKQPTRWERMLRAAGEYYYRRGAFVDKAWLIALGIGDYLYELVVDKLVGKYIWTRWLKKYFFLPPEESFNAALVKFAYLSPDMADAIKGLSDDQAGQKLLKIGYQRSERLKGRDINFENGKKVAEKAIRALQLARVYGAKEAYIFARLAVIYGYLKDDKLTEKYAKMFVDSSLAAENPFYDEVMRILVEISLKNANFKEAKEYRDNIKAPEAKAGVSQKIFSAAAKEPAKTGYFKEAYEKSTIKKMMASGWKSRVVVAFPPVIAALAIYDFMMKPNYEGTLLQKLWQNKIAKGVINTVVSATLVFPYIIKPIFGIASPGGIFASISAVLTVVVITVIAVLVIVTAVKKIREVRAKAAEVRAWESTYYGDRKARDDRARLANHYVSEAERLQRENKADEAAKFIEKAEELAWGQRGITLKKPLPDDTILLRLVRLYYLALYDKEADKDKKDAYLTRAKEILERIKKAVPELSAEARLIEAAIAVKEGGDIRRALWLLEKFDANKLSDPLKLDYYSLKIEILCREWEVAAGDRKKELEGQIKAEWNKAERIIIPGEGKPDPENLRGRSGLISGLYLNHRENVRKSAAAKEDEAKSEYEAAKKSESQRSAPVPKKEKEEKKVEPYKRTARETIDEDEITLKSESAKTPAEKARLYYSLAMAYSEEMDKEPAPIELRWYTVRPISWAANSIVKYFTLTRPYNRYFESTKKAMDSLDAKDKMAFVRHLLTRGDINRPEDIEKYLKTSIAELNALKGSADNVETIELILSNVKVLMALVNNLKVPEKAAVGDSVKNMISELKKIELLLKDDKLSSARQMAAQLIEAGNLFLFSMAEAKYVNIKDVERNTALKDNAGEDGRAALRALIKLCVEAVSAAGQNETKYRLINNKLLPLYRELFGTFTKSGEYVPVKECRDAVLLIAGLTGNLGPKEAAGVLENTAFIAQALIAAATKDIKPAEEKITVVNSQLDVMKMGVSDIGLSPYKRTLRLLITLQAINEAQSDDIAKDTIDELIAFLKDKTIDKELKAAAIRALRIPPKAVKPSLVSSFVVLISGTDIDEDTRRIVFNEIMKSLPPLSGNQLIVDSDLLGWLKTVKTASDGKLDDVTLLEAMIFLQDQCIGREEKKFTEYVQAYENTPPTDDDVTGSFNQAVTDCLAAIKKITKVSDDNRVLFDHLTTQFAALMEKIQKTSRAKRINDILGESLNYTDDFILKLLSIDIDFKEKEKLIDKLFYIFKNDREKLAEILEALRNNISGLTSDAGRIEGLRYIASSVNKVTLAVIGFAGNVNDPIRKEALLTPLYNLLLTLSKEEKLDQVSKERVAANLELARAAIERIKKSALESAQKEDSGARQAEYDLRMGRAGLLASAKRYAEAVKEYEDAAALFDKAFESAPTDDWDRRMAAIAVGNVLAAYEEIADLREKMDNPVEELTAKGKRDNWIIDHWKLFDEETNARIRKKHEASMNKYSFDKEGFYRRSQDSINDSIRLSNLDPVKRMEAAKERAGKEIDLEAERKSHSLAVEAATGELDKKKKEIGEKETDKQKLTAERQGLLNKKTAAETELKTLRDTREAEYIAKNKNNRLPTIGENLSAMDDKEAGIILDIEELTALVTQKEAELKDVEAAVLSLSREIGALEAKVKKEFEEEGKARDKRDEILNDPLMIDSAEAAVRDCMGVLRDARQPAEGKIAEAMKTIIDLFNLNNAGINNEISRVLREMDAYPATITDAKTRRMMTDRLEKLRRGIAEAAVGKNFRDDVRGRFLNGVDLAIKFDLGADRSVEVSSGLLFEELITRMGAEKNEYEILTFLGQAYKANSGNAIGAIALARVIDILYKRFDIAAKASSKDIDIDMIMGDKVFDLIEEAGIDTDRLKIILDECKDEHESFEAWHKLSDHRKAIIVSALKGIFFEKRYASVKEYLDKIVDPVGFVEVAGAIYRTKGIDTQGNDYYRAISLCEDAVKIDENDMDARTLLGYLYLGQYRYAKAEEQFKKVKESKSGREKESLGRLIYIYADRGDLALVAGALKELVPLYLEKNEYDPALELVSGLVILSPKSAEAVTLKAKILIKRNQDGDVEKAIKMLDDIINKKTGKEFTGYEAAKKDALGLRAEALSIRGDIDKALKDAKKASKLGYESKSVFMLLAGEALASLGSMLWLVRNSRFEKARDILKKAIAISEKPDIFVYEKLLNLLLVNMKTYDVVIQEAEDALKAKDMTDDDKKVLKNYIVRASIEKAKKNVKKTKLAVLLDIEKAKKSAAEIGVDAVNKISADVRSIQDAIVKLCRRDAEGVGFLRSITLYAWRLRRAGNRDRYFEVSFDLARALKARDGTGNIDAAIAALKEFSDDDKTREGLAQTLGDLYRIKADRSRNVAEKITLYNESLKFDNKNFKALVGRGLIYAVNEDKIDEATEDLSAALNIPYEDDELELAEEAAGKLIELKSRPDAVRDAQGKRIVEDGLEEMKKAIAAKDKAVKPEGPGKSAENIAQAIVNLVKKDDISDSEKANIEEQLMALRVDNGMKALQDNVATLIESGDIKDAQRVIALLRSVMAGMNFDTGMFDKLDTIFNEKKDSVAFESLIKNLKKDRKYIDAMMLRLAAQLKIQGAEKLLRENKLYEKIEAENAKPENSIALIKALRAKIEAAESEFNKMISSAVSAGGAIEGAIAGRESFTYIYGKIKALPAQGNVDLAKLIVNMLMSAAYLRASEKRALRMLKADMSKDAESTPPVEPGILTVRYTDVTALILKAKLLIEAAKVKDAAEVIAKVLEWRKNNKIDDRFDDKLAGLIGSMIGILRSEAAKKSPKEKPDLTEALGPLISNIGALFTSKQRAVKIADTVLPPDAKSIPYALCRAFFESSVLADKERVIILRKMADMAKDSAIADVKVTEWIDTLKRQKKFKAMANLMLGWIRYNAASSKSGDEADRLYREALKNFNTAGKDKSLKAEASAGAAQAVTGANKGLVKDSPVNAIKEKILEGKYDRGIKGIEAKLSDIRRLFDIDAAKRSDADILKSIEALRAMFTKKLINKNKDIYHAVIIENAGCLAAKGELKKAEEMITNSGISINKNAEASIVMRDIRLKEGNYADAMMLHERACALNAEYGRKRSTEMAKIYYERAGKDIESDTAIEDYRKAVGLDSENEAYPLALAQALYDVGRDREAKEALQALKDTQRGADMTEEGRSSFNYLKDDKNKKAAQELSKNIDDLTQDVSNLSKALELATKKEGIVSRLNRIAYKESLDKQDMEERGRLIKALDAVIEELEDMLTYPVDIIKLDSKANIKKRKDNSLKSLRFKNIYALQLVSIITGRIMESGPEGLRLSVVASAEEAVARGDNDMAEKLLSALDKVNKKLKSDKRGLLKANIAAARAAGIEDPLGRNARLNKAAGNYRALANSKDLKIKYTARLRLVKTKLSMGEKISDIDLKDLDISDLSDKELEEIKGLIPEILSNYLYKSAALSDAKVPGAYNDAFSIVTKLLSIIDAAKPDNLVLVEELIRDMNTCLYGAKSGISIDSAVADRLKDIFIYTGSFALAERIADLFVFMRDGLYLSVLSDMIIGDTLTDGEKLQIAARLNTMWFDAIKSGTLIFNKAYRPIVGKIIEELTGYLKERGRDGAVMRNLSLSLGYLEYLRLSYEKAAGYFVAAGDDVRAMFSLFKAYDKAGDERKAGKIRSQIEVRYSASYPDLVGLLTGSSGGVTAKAPGAGERFVNIDIPGEVMPVDTGMIMDIWKMAGQGDRAPPVVKLIVHATGGKFFISDSGNADVEAFSRYSSDGELEIHVTDLHYKDELSKEASAILTQIIAHEIAENTLDREHFEAANFEKQFATDRAKAIRSSDRILFCVDQAANRGDTGYLKELLGEQQHRTAISDPDGYRLFRAYVEFKLNGSVTAIGIVCNTESDFRKVADMNLEVPPGVQFIGVKSSAEFEAITEGTDSRILIDITELNAPAIAEIGKIGQTESIRSFILKYPYLVSLNKDNISALNRDALKDILDIIMKSFPQARSLDLDNILTDISKESAGRQAAITDIDTNTEKWVEEYTDAIVLKDINEIDKKQAELIDRLAREESPAKMREVLAYHQAIATAQYWKAEKERAGSSDSFCAAMVDHITSGMTVFAFDAKLLKNDLPLKNVLSVIRAAQGKPFLKVVILKESVNDPDPISGYSDVIIEARDSIEGKDISTKLINLVKSRTGEDVTASVIAMAETSVPIGDVRNDYVSKTKEEMPSYIMIKPDQIISANIGEITVATALRNTPCFIALGYSTSEAGKFKDIEDFLNSINGWFIMIKDVGKAITQIFNAIKQTSISV